MNQYFITQAIIITVAIVVFFIGIDDINRKMRRS